MKTNKKTSVYSIMVIVITALIMTTVVGTDDIYAASKQSKVKSHRNAIKSYNNKTKKIAKKTEAANKYAKKTSGYYKKAKKTKSLKKLKNLRSKAKSSYNTAKCLDYKRQVKDVYIEIKKISDKAPSMDTFVSQALSTHNKANKSKSVSTLKSYLSSINSLHKNAKSHKATLTWYEEEYHMEQVAGYYKTVTVQEREGVVAYVYAFWTPLWDSGRLTESIWTTNGLDGNDLSAGHPKLTIEYHLDNPNRDKELTNLGIMSWINETNPSAIGTKAYAHSGWNWLDGYRPSGTLATSKNGGGFVGLREMWDNLLAEGKTNGNHTSPNSFFIELKPKVTEQRWVSPTEKKVIDRKAGWY